MPFSEDAELKMLSLLMLAAGTRMRHGLVGRRVERLNKAGTIEF